MPVLTTEDCKEFLVDYYAKQGIQTTDKEWTRIKKYKPVAGATRRDFKHPLIGEVPLVEHQGALNVDINNIKAPTNSTPGGLYQFKQKVFKNVVLGRVKKLESYYTHATFERVQASEAWKNDWHALPALFKYEFGSYVNVKMNDSALGVAVKFTPVSTGNIQILKHDSLVPKYLKWSDAENTYVVSESVELKQVVEDLAIRGYTYDIQNCSLAKTMSDAGFTPDLKVKGLKEQYVMIERKLVAAIISDDVKMLQTILNEGFDINRFVGHYNLLSMSSKQGAIACFDYLLDNGVDVLNYANVYDHWDGCALSNIITDNRYGSVLKDHPDLAKKARGLLLNTDFSKVDDLPDKLGLFFHSPQMMSYDPLEIYRVLKMGPLELLNKVQTQVDPYIFAEIVVKAAGTLIPLGEGVMVVDAVKKVSEMTLLETMIKATGHYQERLFVPVLMMVLDELYKRNFNANELHEQHPPTVHYLKRLHDVNMNELQLRVSNGSDASTYKGIAQFLADITPICKHFKILDGSVDKLEPEMF